MALSSLYINPFIERDPWGYVILNFSLQNGEKPKLICSFLRSNTIFWPFLPDWRWNSISTYAIRCLFLSWVKCENIIYMIHFLILATIYIANVICIWFKTWFCKLLKPKDSFLVSIFPGFVIEDRVHLSSSPATRFIPYLNIFLYRYQALLGQGQML